AARSAPSRVVVRGRPGTAKGSELVAIPDQQCTAPREDALHRIRDTPIYAPRAPRTRSGANGSSRSRTPVSAAMALPTAQASTGRPSSPAPVGGLSVETTLTSMLGTSDIRAIW